MGTESALMSDRTSQTDCGTRSYLRGKVDPFRLFADECLLCLCVLGSECGKVAFGVLGGGREGVVVLLQRSGQVRSV